MTFHKYNYTAFTWGGKSIFNPRRCIVATAHSCLVSKKTFDVDQGDALMHHYKGCSQRGHKGRKQCEQTMDNGLMFTINSTEKFHTRLKQAVHKTFHDLKLWGF